MLKTIAVAAGLVLLAAAPAGGRRAQDSECPATVANGLASTGSSTQLITVVAAHPTSTRATVRLWKRSAGCWTPLSGSWTAWLGRRGVSAAKREGDKTTPAGVFGIGRTMYGIAPNPGVRYAYRRIVCGDWWVEDPRSPFYNRFHHVKCGAKPPFTVTSEDLSRSPTAYRHLAVIQYNADPVAPGRGSGIFLHASTGRPTLGCVSFPLPKLVSTLRWLRPSSAPLIAIGTRASLATG
jgi:L,D-peptidoglycan transpeptidase YkuD (ErfK/YbiS/YcfS/YnhG family)